MKAIILILSLLLSCVFSDNGRMHDIVEDSINEASVESSDSDSAGTTSDFNDLAILPAGTASYSGGGSNFAPSVRSSNSGRRVQPSSKSTFRIIRAGKLFDRNNLYAFQALILQFKSGMHSNSRYIHSICHLLI